METIPFLEYSLYQMFHMFIFWSFIGWCIEVCDMTLETGEYQNRGFLNMPICPIYGFGVLMVVIFFRPISHTFVPLFLLTMILCTTFELLVGLGMEKMFGARWWDYSNKKFNYKGYICPEISILWGLGCVIVVRIVHPMVERVVDLIPVKMGLVLICLWSVLIIIDLISSICAVNELNNRLKQIDEISKVMLLSAVKIGGNLAEKTLETKERYDKIVESADAKTHEWKEKYYKYFPHRKDKQKIDEIEREYGKIVEAEDFKISDWRERFEKLVEIKDSSVERLLKAFPQLRSISYSEAMDALKIRLAEMSHRRKNKDRETHDSDEENFPEEDVRQKL
ncbi:MAG: putative ABC transporter permease [Oscillospiraceae bacterium]|nr:putative ABC transporter permease [Oscillospiraceae bacterium]